MKQTLLSALAPGLALVLLTSGCGSKENTSAEQNGPAMTNSLAATAADLRQTVQQAAVEARTTVEAATAEVGSQAQAVTSRAQTLIDQAKTLIADKKYNEAWETLTRVSGLQLTPEQKKVVDDLKANLQKLMANPGVSNAVNAARGMLN